MSSESMDWRRALDIALAGQAFPHEQDAARYRGEAGEPELRQRVRATVDWIVEEATGDVVDLGCGDGIVALCLAQNGRRVAAVEPKAGLRAVAQTLRDEAGAQRMSVHDGPLDAAPVEDASADTVVLRHTLARADDAAALLAEARRVLRDDGRLLVTVPAGLGGWSPLRLASALEDAFAISRMDIAHGVVRAVAHPGADDPDARARLAGQAAALTERVLAEAGEAALHVRALAEQRAHDSADTEWRLADAVRRAEAADQQAREHRRAERARQHLEAEVVGLRTALEQAQTEARHRAAEAEKAARRVAGLQEERARLREAVRVERDKVRTMRSRRWWRLGLVLSEARHSPRRLLALPLDVLRLLRRSAT